MSRKKECPELYDEALCLMSRTRSPVTKTCKVTGWSRTAYYELLNNRTDPGVQKVQRLVNYLKEIEGSKTSKKAKRNWRWEDLDGKP